MDLTRSRSAAIKQIHSLTSAVKVDRHGEAYHLSIERTTPHGSVLIELDDLTQINQISYDCTLHVLADVAYSEDGKRFFRIHGIKHESSNDKREFVFPLVEARFLQVNLYQEGGPVHKSDLKKLQIGFKSKIKVQASSESDRLWTAENLLDRREDYGWASTLREKNAPESVSVDLGESFFVTEFHLKALNEEYNYFPQAFQIQLSEDGAIWQTVQSEDKFFAAPGAWYAWRFAPLKSRFARIQIEKNAHYKKEEYQSKILDLAIIASADSICSSAPSERVASENVAGVVLLAGNNIAAPNRVLQSNDLRLRNASTEYKGIMQFARDNEAAQEKAVQGSDSRLNAASETALGIVRLARDGESLAHSVVQANDKRLKPATQDSLGIVQLAKDGEAKANVALQANDSRLKIATEQNAGIIYLARDKEESAGKVVQSNDSRLKQASLNQPGVVQFASHSESAPNKALASDDPRLQEASEEKKGRVQFAKKNEAADFKAVQASDPRLHSATRENRGVVQFARDGVSIEGYAVEATDKRLLDARAPKPHVHEEYALKEHSLSSHSGTLHIQSNTKTALPDGFAVVSDSNAPLDILNTQGVAGVFSGGIIASAEETASYHISRSGNALHAASRDAAAGVFVSATDYAVKIPASTNGVTSSQKALHAQGHVLIEGQVSIKGKGALSVTLSKSSNETFVEGDLLSIENGLVSKMRSVGQYCVGVFVKESAVQLEPSGDGVRVAVAGVVSLRVYGAVKAGDALALNPSQAGTCRVVQNQDRAVAVALEGNSNDREKIVQSILVR